MSLVVHGPGDRKQFALTFDDGPERGVTDLLLDLLAERRVRATFFCVGDQVERDPGLARQILEQGHEVGSHSMRHLDHAAVEPAQALSDMLDGVACLERELGVEPRLYRAPYGHFVPATLAEAEQRGWACVYWSAWGLDWLPDDGATIAARVLEHLRAGAIVVLHDAQRFASRRTDCTPTLEATGTLLGEAGRRGLEPVTVSELLEAHGAG